MIKMLSIAILQSLVVYLSMKVVKYPSEGLEEHWAFELNSTAIDGGRDEFKYEHDEEELRYDLQNRATIKGISLIYCIASSLFHPMLCLFIGLSYTFAFCAPLPAVILVASVYLYSGMVVSHFHPLLFAVIMISAAAISTVIVAFGFVNKAEQADLLAVRLAKDRIATGGSMNDEASFKRRPKTTWDILQLTLVVATPPFFVLGVNILFKYDNRLFIDEMG